jgi:hypothetical protein
MTGNKNKKVMEYIRALSKVEDFYTANHIKNDIFPLLRFKICYKLLLNCSLKEAKTDNKFDYYFLYEQFYKEIFLIIKHPLFLRLYFGEKLFIIKHLIDRIVRK